MSCPDAKADEQETPVEIPPLKVSTVEEVEPETPRLTPKALGAIISARISDLQLRRVAAITDAPAESSFGVAVERWPTVRPCRPTQRIGWSSQRSPLCCAHHSSADGACKKGGGGKGGEGRVHYTLEAESLGVPGHVRLQQCFYGELLACVRGQQSVSRFGSPEAEEPQGEASEAASQSSTGLGEELEVASQYSFQGVGEERRSMEESAPRSTSSTVGEVDLHVNLESELDGSPAHASLEALKFMVFNVGRWERLSLEDQALIKAHVASLVLSTEVDRVSKIAEFLAAFSLTA